MPICAVIPSCFCRASICSGVMSCRKSISPLMSAWTAGSSALNTRKSTSSTCGFPLPVVGVRLQPVRRAAGRALHQRERSGPDHRPVLGLVGVGVRLLLADVLPDVLRHDRDRHQRKRRARLAQAQHHRLRVGRRDLLHVVQVRDPGVGVDPAVEDPLVGEHHVVGGQLLAVVPGDVVAHVEGPGEPVVGRLPVLGQLGHGRQVLHRVADQLVVHQVPHLVRRALDALERVERVDLVEQPDREGDLLVGLAASGGCGQRRASRPLRPTTRVPRPPGSQYGAPLSSRPAVETPRRRRGRPTSTASTESSRPDPYHWMRDVDSPERRSPISSPNGPGTTLPPGI